MTAGRLGPLATPLFLGLVLLGFHLGTDAWIRARPDASRPRPVEPEAEAEAEAKAKAEAEKMGVCPGLTEDLNCTRECGSDGKCTDNLKCCRDGCGWVCHPPDEKPGSCPKVDLPLTPLGLCRDQCQVDSQCPDQMKCCRNGCGKVSCVTPVF